MRPTPAKAKPAPLSVSGSGRAQALWPVWLLAVMLLLLTVALYWPATGHDFINYDDPLYVTGNPHVQAGLTWEGLAWAFGRLHGQGTYWHPLTWLSHMADCQLYGLKPWGHHLTSVMLHALNAILVFLVFLRLTGAFWRCALLAALFAVHPLQVDSVAWVSERKNLLSTFFWLLTTWAYVRYADDRMENAECGSPKAEARRPKEDRNPKSEEPRLAAVPGSTFDVRRSMFHVRPYAPPSSLPTPIFYLLSLLFFALGLMCKPVLVTLPFVLLLLDYWPLGRMKNVESRIQNTETSASGHASPDTHHVSRLTALLPLVLEKLPFLAMAAASSLITLLSHHALGAVSRLSWNARLENTVISYVRYLAKIFWPSRLAVFYPYPKAWPMWEVVFCGLLLLAISVWAVGTARSRPWLFVGWFWFLGVLVPFNGLVQAGAQAMADRFIYIPILGLLVAVLWALSELGKGVRHQHIGLSLAGAAAIALCLVLTHRQLGYWTDSEALFRHALDVTANNYIAHNNLGYALDDKGHLEEAMRQYQEALRLKPNFADAHNNLGIALSKKGQTDDAIRHYQEAIRIQPDHADAHNDLGTALGAKGQLDEAIRQFREAIRLKPDGPEAHTNLGAALLKQGQVDEAIRHLKEALRLKPDYALAHEHLGSALDQHGQMDEAIRQFQEVVRLQPDNLTAHYRLGSLFVRKGQTEAAIQQFQEATRLNPDDAIAHNGLGVALARLSQMDEAIHQFQEALRLKPDYASASNNLRSAFIKKGQIEGTNK